MSYRGRDGWEVWGRATQCLRQGIASVGERWRDDGGGGAGETCSRRIRIAFGEHRRGGKTCRERVPEAEINNEGRWSSDSFIVYVRGNMEDPVWVSEVLEHGAEGVERQPGQGTRWGGMGKVPPCPVM